MMLIKKPVLILNVGRNRFDSVTTYTFSLLNDLGTAEVYYVTPLLVKIG